MEDNDRYCVGLKYWKVEERGRYANISCPAITENRVDGFRPKREIYREFKTLEKLLAGHFKGWVTWTEIKNVHIIRFAVKVGARPYHYDLDYNTIWFTKRFGSNKNGNI